MEMRHRILALLIPLALVGGYAEAAPNKQGPMKCWTNKEGVRECGNAVPPEFAQGETRTIDNRGIAEVKERAKTPEELAAEDAQRKAEAARKAEEERVKQERLRRDQVLLSVYTSVGDITKQRDQRLAAIQSSTDLAASSAEGLKRKVADEQKRAANYERQGKPVPEDVKKHLAELERQLNDKQDFIAAKAQEREETKAKYEADLTRFKELKKIE